MYVHCCRRTVQTSCCSLPGMDDQLVWRSLGDLKKEEHKQASPNFDHFDVLEKTQNLAEFDLANEEKKIRFGGI